jgi:hypothetical protein
VNTELIELIMAGNNRFNIDVTRVHIGVSQELFDDLVEIMLSAGSPISQRAAWTMTAVIDYYPWLLNSKINLLINSMQDFKHPALTRCLLRVLSQVNIPYEKFGVLFDQCYNYLIDSKQPAAVRVFALQVLYNITEKEPELKHELVLIIENIIDGSSEGLKNRAGKLLHKLRKPKASS